MFMLWAAGCNRREGIGLAKSYSRLEAVEKLVKDINACRCCTTRRSRIRVCRTRLPVSDRGIVNCIALPPPALAVYALYALGLTPLQYGPIDGLYQGAAALARLAGGVSAGHA